MQLNRATCLFYKQPVCKEPKCRMPNYLKNTPTKAEFRRELFNVNNFYYTKQSRVRKPVPFICSQNPHRLCAIPVLGLPFFHLSYIITKLKGKIQDFNGLLVS